MSYQIRNWSEYNAGLQQRGSVTVWLDPSAIDHWLEDSPSNKQGASVAYSDTAISTFDTIKCIYGLAGRQTAGFLGSLLGGLSFALVTTAPSLVTKVSYLCYSPLFLSKAPFMSLSISTGVKVYGEGEWKTRQQGVSKCRTWRKLPLSVDESTGEILIAVVTTHDVHEGEVFEDLFEGIDDEIEQGSADGADDQSHCYDALIERHVTAAIPPRKNAKI